MAEMGVICPIWLEDEQATGVNFPGVVTASAFGPVSGTATLTFGTGIPAGGVAGSFYLRVDGGGAGATHLYFNNAGTWLGLA